MTNNHAALRIARRIMTEAAMQTIGGVNVLDIPSPYRNGRPDHAPRELFTQTMDGLGFRPAIRNRPVNDTSRMIPCITDNDPACTPATKTAGTRNVVIRALAPGILLTRRERAISRADGRR